MINKTKIINPKKATIKWIDDNFLGKLYFHDNYTYWHSVRVAFYLTKIADFLNLPKKEAQLLYEVGLLHDIGKLKVPKNILTKTEILQEQEWETVKLHPIYGSMMVTQYPYFTSEMPEIILQHHENYNGTGYPFEKKGEELNIYARLLRVVDSFDAMHTTRSYSNARTTTECVNELYGNKGSLYDSTMVDLFIHWFNDGEGEGEIKEGRGKLKE